MLKLHKRWIVLSSVWSVFHTQGMEQDCNPVIHQPMDSYGNVLIQQWLLDTKKTVSVTVTYCTVTKFNRKPALIIHHLEGVQEFQSAYPNQLKRIDYSIDDGPRVKRQPNRIWKIDHEQNPMRILIPIYPHDGGFGMMAHQATMATRTMAPSRNAFIPIASESKSDPCAVRCLLMGHPLMGNHYQPYMNLHSPLLTTINHYKPWWITLW